MTFAEEFPRGYFIANRHPDADDLLEHYPPAILMAYTIGKRARYREGVGSNGLEQGECYIGDHKKMGLTPRQYRTCIEKLSKAGFATFRTTNKCTIAKLLDTRLFAITKPDADEQNDKQPTNNRQATDKQPTRNNKGIREEGKKGKVPPEPWQVEKDRERIKEQIKDLKISGSESQMAELKRQLRELDCPSDGKPTLAAWKDELAAHGVTKTSYAEEKFYDQEAKGWRGIVDWRSYAKKMKVQYDMYRKPKIAV